MIDNETVRPLKLPMTSMLIVATADNHLSRYHARMSPSKLEARRARLRAGFQAAVDYAVDHGACLFLHGGDLFDSPGPTNADLGFVAHCLRRLRRAGVGVCAVGGNHDTPSGTTVQGGVAPLSPLADLEGLFYFGKPALEKRRLVLGGLEVCIGGLTPSPGPVSTDPLASLLSDEGTDVDIFLTHGTIEGHGFPGAQEPVLGLATATDLPHLKLVVAGHIHKHSCERVGAALLVAPGATEWMTHGDVGAQPGFLTILYDGTTATEVRHIATTPQPRSLLHLDIGATSDDPHEAATELIAAHSTSETLMKLSLAGGATREQYLSLRLRELQLHGESLNFHFDLDATGLYLREEFAGNVARGVRVSQQEEISTVAAELISQAGSEEERSWLSLARDALLGEYS